MTRRLGKIFTGFFNDQKLLSKLMFTNFVLIIFPLMFFTLLSNNSISKAIENQVLFSEEQVFEQTDSFLSYKISKVIDISDIISVDKNIITILTKDIGNYDTAMQMQDLYDLNTFYLTPYQKEDDVYRVRLYVRDNIIYSQEKVNLFSIKDAEGTAWYNELLMGKSKILWCPPDYFNSDPYESNRVISAARVIKDPNLYNRIIGVFRIDIQESNIIDILKKANITPNSVTYLQNANEVVIACSDNALLKNLSVPYSTVNDLSMQDKNFTETHISGEKYLLGSRSISGTDWTLASLVPYDEILSASKNIQNRMLLLFAIIGTLTYVLSYYLSGSTTNRIHHVIERMKKAEDGNFAAIESPQGKDEIGELVVTFNYMIEKIRLLINEEYLLGQQAKSSELKALQEQINPHFLYNTLDLINWTAIRKDIPEISSVVQTLAKFYKLSLSRGHETVSIADEITHVALYVTIQNMRFENRIRFQTDIDDEILKYSIIKITLQPLVENSILHGILEKEGSGSLTLSGRFEGDNILLTVEDDGMGMTEEQLDAVLKPSHTEKHGYGVANVNERIKIHYGDQYGLKYYSTIGQGTRVEIRIPALKQDTSGKAV